MPTLYISGSQEREMLKLIAAKDALAGGAAAGDDAVGELEDNLYEANAKLEEEQERATGLEEDKGLTLPLTPPLTPTQP